MKKLILCLMFGALASALQAVPTEIPFEADATGLSRDAEGFIPMHFSVTTNAAGGDAVWSHAYTLRPDAMNRVRVTLSDAALASRLADDPTAPWYLRVEVAGSEPIVRTLAMTAAPLAENALEVRTAAGDMDVAGTLRADVTEVKGAATFNGNFKTAGTLSLEGNACVKGKLISDAKAKVEKVEVKGRVTLAGTQAYTGPGAVQAGMIIPWTRSTIPAGWRVCDGSGGTPNLMGQFLVGVGRAAAGEHEYTLGETGGAAEVLLTEAQTPSHTHNFSYRRAAYTGYDFNSVQFCTDADIGLWTGTTTASFETDQQGYGVAHNNLPKYLKLVYIMRMP